MKTLSTLLALCFFPITIMAFAACPILGKTTAAQLIQKTLNTESGECVLANGNPVANAEAISIPRADDTIDGPASSTLNALTKLGFFEKSVGTDIDIDGARHLGTVFTLTPKGKQYVSKDSSPGRFYFCSGKYKLTGIKAINQGTDEDRQAYTSVEYTHRLTDVADWMKSREILQSDPERDLRKKYTSSENIAHATLAKNPLDWEVTSTFDMHDE